MENNLTTRVQSWLRNQYPGVDINIEPFLDSGSFEEIKERIRREISSIPLQRSQIYYRPIQRAIEKVVSGYSHLCFIKGNPGTGKSFHIRKTLDALGAEYVVLNGDITEAYLYRILWEQNGKIIWCNDVSRLLKGLRGMNLLKAACETEEKRIITKNNYSIYEADLPDRFEFTGRLIFDYNQLPSRTQSIDFQAIESRGDVIDFHLFPEQIAEIMRDICTTEEEKEITEFLIEHFPSVHVLNLRIQYKAFKTYKYAIQYNLDWKEEVLSELDQYFSPIKRMLFSIIGTRTIPVQELKKKLLQTGKISSLRTADRRIHDWIEIGELEKVSEHQRGFLVRV